MGRIGHESFDVVDRSMGHQLCTEPHS
jgi:hypothetical protein